MISAFAGGPLDVTGYQATQPGRPYRWIGNSIQYKTDLGSLGAQTNAQANSLVSSAFQAWQNVSTASLNIQYAGPLSGDIRANNYQYAIYASCSDPAAPSISIIYDVDGTITDDLGMDSESALGVTMHMCYNDTTGAYTRAFAILNGKFLDGHPESHVTVSVEEFKAVFIHEFGHLLGLDHSQINLNCLIDDDSCPAEDMAGVPIMFPILVDTKTTLTLDDQAAISSIYPASSLNSNMGRIQGRVFFSDGTTPAFGYNVVARKVGDSRTTAISSVSGFLYSPWFGNSLQSGNSPYIYGSLDSSLIGYYDIPGLPPGSYTVEVEPINGDGDYAFTGSSSVGPIGALQNIGFQFKMPGACTLQYFHTPSSASDGCSDKSTVTVGGGYTTSANVIFLGTESRYDQWEDGQ
jgi:hypothetical protein